ncbi:MAG: hypothetical protein IPJ13_32060 [Saprospiraceae bacterium]|nr:hypothetical protein [Saprospiraceae bacterium]
MKDRKLTLGDPTSVRKINLSDNRGAGNSIGKQIKDLKDGTPVIILPKDLQGN